jgi:hypothetical protein
MIVFRFAVALPLLAVLSFPALAKAEDPSAAVKKAEQAIALFRKTDPSIEKFFAKSAGWAVFPSVAKGAIGGLMYEASVGGQKFGFEPFGQKTK